MLELVEENARTGAAPPTRVMGFSRVRHWPSHRSLITRLKLNRSEINMPSPDFSSPDFFTRIHWIIERGSSRDGIMIA